MPRLKTIFIGSIYSLSFFALVSCTPLAKVKKHAAVFLPLNEAKETISPHDRLLLEGKRLSRKEPLKAIGCYLTCAEFHTKELRQNPADKQAQEAYNFAVARIIEVIQKADLRPWEQSLIIPGPQKEYTLSFRKNHKPDRNPARYRTIPADTIDTRGLYFKERVVTQGLGAPLIAIGKQANLDYRERFSEKHIYGSVTGVIRFKGSHAEIEFLEPLFQEKTTLDGHRYTIAADLTAPLTLLMAETRPEKLGLARLLRPENYADTAALTRLQAYDPNRIPVILVHGLDSTPATWVPMLNSLRGDAEIRRKYQFWVFSYPSGYAYPYSAALLRKELDRVNQVFPDHKPFVLIGHSMGSLINRLQMTDVGEKMWLHYFAKRPSETSFAGASKQLIEETLIFNSRNDVSRSIFICGPHRGSSIASNWVGRLGSRLIKAPTFAADLRDAMVSIITVDESSLKLKSLPNSIDTLAPTNRFVREINKFPIDSKIPYHSIIGDRGRGNTPNSSDGVVPYWSSHLEGAQSEKIVPHNHGSHQSPEAIEEVLRILRLHGGIKSSNQN